jgi:hypothetical protein
MWDAHDNEILYDALAFKLPAGTSAADRGRMQTVSLATTVLGQGTGFVTAGSDLLRSKSLDRNSYNSGDWFNAVHWDCADGNGFGAACHRPPTTRTSGSTAGRCSPIPRWCPAARRSTPAASGTPTARGALVVAGVRVADGGRGAEAAGVPAAGPVGHAGRHHDDARRARRRPAVEEPGGGVQRDAERGDPARARLRRRADGAAPGAGELGRPVVRTASFGNGTFTVPARTVAVFVQT